RAVRPARGGAGAAKPGARGRFGGGRGAPLGSTVNGGGIPADSPNHVFGSGPTGVFPVACTSATMTQKLPACVSSGERTAAWITSPATAVLVSTVSRAAPLIDEPSSLSSPVPGCADGGVSVISAPRCPSGAALSS